MLSCAHARPRRLIDSIGDRTVEVDRWKAYDDALTAGVRGWKIEPYRVDGAAVAVCTVFVFIYMTS